MDAAATLAYEADAGGVPHVYGAGPTMLGDPVKGSRQGLGGGLLDLSGCFRETAGMVPTRLMRSSKISFKSRF